MTQIQIGQKMKIALVTGNSLSSSEIVCNQYGGDSWLNRKGWIDGDFLTIDYRNYDINWYSNKGKSVVRKYSFDKRPICAVFCALVSSNHSEKEVSYKFGVAILASGQDLQIHYKTGEKFEILLPSTINTMVASPHGLILQGIAGVNSFSHLFAMDLSNKASVPKNVHYCISSPFSPIYQISSPESIVAKYHLLAINNDVICMNCKESNQIALFTIEKQQIQSKDLKAFEMSDTSFMSVDPSKSALLLTGNSKASKLSKSPRTSRYTPSPTPGRNSKTNSPAFFNDASAVLSNSIMSNNNQPAANSSYNHIVHSVLGVKQDTKGHARHLDRVPSIDQGRLSMGSQFAPLGMSMMHNSSFDPTSSPAVHSLSHYHSNMSNVDVSLDQLTIDGIQNDLFLTSTEAVYTFQQMSSFQFSTEETEEDDTSKQKKQQMHNYAAYFHEHLHHLEGIYFHILDKQTSILFQFHLEFLSPDLSTPNSTTIPTIQLLHTIDLDELKVICDQLIAFSLPCPTSSLKKHAITNEHRDLLSDAYSLPMILLLCQNELGERGFKLQIVGTNLFYWYTEDIVITEQQTFTQMLSLPDNTGSSGAVEQAFRSLFQHIVTAIPEEPPQTIQIKSLTSSNHPSFASITYDNVATIFEVTFHSDDAVAAKENLVSPSSPSALMLEIMITLRKVLLSTFPSIVRPFLSLWMSLQYQGIQEELETCIFILCSALFGIDFELVTSKYPNILEVSDPSYIHYPYLEVVKVLNDTSILEIESQRQQLELVVMHAMTYFMWHWLLQSTPISIEIYHQLHPVLQQLFSWLLQLKSKKSMISPMLQKFYDFVYFPIKPLQTSTSIVTQYFTHLSDQVDRIFLPVQSFLFDVCWNVYLVYHFLFRLSALSFTTNTLMDATSNMIVEGHKVSIASIPMNSFNLLAKHVVQAFIVSVETILSSSKVFESSQSTSKLVSEISDEQWKTILNSLPTCIQSIVQIAFLESAVVADNSWPKPLLEFMGRNDLCANEHKKVSPSASGTNNNNNEQHSDGLHEVETQSVLRFPDDDRMHEVCRMLRSSTPTYVKVEKTPDLSDGDYRLKQQTRLAYLSRRVLGNPVGRGMLTIGTVEPLMAETLPIPPVCITGRAPPNNMTITIDTSVFPLQWNLWPEFHNGVAAALRIGPKVISSHNSHNSINKVTRNWILYNKTESLNIPNTDSSINAQGNTGENTHAGFLLGLGLFGHLDVLTINDLCDYLTHGHELTCIAVLLGVTASKISTADRMISKTLCLHLPSLLPSQNWDIAISPHIQCAALVGLGFLYCRSGNRLIIQFLLEELIRKPFSDSGSECRESLAISAAWALGMILLPTTLPKTKSARHVTSSKADDTSAADITTLLNESTAVNQPSIHVSSDTTELLTTVQDLKIEDRLYLLITGGHRPVSTTTLFPTQQLLLHHDPDAKASKILEGDVLNTDITAPAAAIAFALMYMGTHNPKILQRIAIPTTMIALDAIRPDLLLYKSMASCLILWDQVTPTTEWIDEQLPTILLQESLISSAAAKSTGPEKKKYVGPYGRARQASHHNVLSTSACFTLHVNVITGYCLGIGMVYAGTFHPEAKATLLTKLQWIQSFRDNKHPLLKKNELILDKMQKTMLEMSACAISLSLACVMAGSGDIECLRIFRELRWRIEDVVYGSQQAFSMAIGMLFLGGGKYSLKRDPIAIASLLLSIIPRYPIRTTDQQYHLQAWRHLYVLAVEPRVLHTMDIDTGLPVSIDLEVILHTGETLLTKAPGLLPELQNITRIQIAKDMEYYPTSIRLNEHHHSTSLPKPHFNHSSSSSSMLISTKQLPPLYVKKLPSFTFSIIRKKQLQDSYYHNNQNNIAHLKEKLFASLSSISSSSSSSSKVLVEKEEDDNVYWNNKIKELFPTISEAKAFFFNSSNNKKEVPHKDQQVVPINEQVNRCLLEHFIENYPIIRALLLSICEEE